MSAAGCHCTACKLGYTRNFCSEQHNKRTGYVCNSVHLVMREMMQGLEVGLVIHNTFTRLCGQLSSKLCCLPVCVLSWLISYFNFGQARLHHLAPGHPGQVPGHEAGTKSIARLYTLGGAEWFVTVLVERLLGLVYSTDLDRATAAVFSLLHIDLVPCSLALLLHTLPRCLVGEGREQLLVQPRGQVPRAPHRGLPRRQPQQPRQHGRGSTAYTGRGSTADLAVMCDGSQQPVKLRKLCGGGAEVTAVPGQPAPSQDQLVDQAHTGLFQLLAGLGMEPVSVSFSEKLFQNTI